MSKNMIYFIKPIVSKSASLNASVQLENYEDLTSFEDIVLLENSSYEKIFKKKYKDDCYSPNKRGIVCIKLGKNKIYRLFRSGNVYKLKSNEIGLTISSIRELCININGSSHNVLLYKGTKTKFFWKNPKHYVRVAYKISIISITLGILGLLLGIISIVF